jgi:transcriptional regulator with XRE-family HTH domain
VVRRTKSIPMIFRKNEFGRDIAARRIELELSLSHVGELINISGATISDYENGNECNMKMQNFLAICNVFDLDPREYFELE